MSHEPLYLTASHTVKGKNRRIQGKPISLRLVVSRIRNKETHKIISVWYLLTNVHSSQVPAGLIALWYYWRWKIESYFKLMKSSGLEMEHWQQE
ncbi:MAG: IS4 family transposase, partial [Planctomycetaceae bacterium]|nr:IS4 family transposase [Planctomycetaceae bacterium]